MELLRRFSFTLLLMMLTTLVACGGGDGGLEADSGGGDFGRGGTIGNGVSILPTDVTLPETESGKGVIYGKVYSSATGTAIEGAVVSAGSLTATSDVDGTYMLVNVPYNARVIVNTSMNGFSEQSQVVNLSALQKAVIVDPSLLAQGVSKIFDPSTDEVISFFTASVSIAADSLVYLDGGAEHPPVGMVTASLTNVDASSDPYIMSGDFSTTDNFLESFGAISVSFIDESGNELNLKTGATSDITIPFASSTTPLETARALYSYSSSTGLWMEKGIANAYESDQLQTAYRATVDHFSTWNVGEEFSGATEAIVIGCAFDEQGAPLHGAVVRARGNDYIGASTAIVDESGNFSIRTKASSTVLINISDQGKISNTVVVDTADGNTISECLSVKDFSISVTLTWGENPADLDTHLVGPDYHIYYVEKGSLSGFPFAALDVDDTTSYGPEVLTMLKPTTNGDYVYSVYHFAGTSNITESPTKVELNFNGDTFVFSPPEGQGVNKTWNVFKVVVDSDLNVTDLRSLQSWTLSSPSL
ncbi:YfaP family protein [Candidatus Colwellia aromaticivorans]|uniref:YfaP family protein n=1 Tax=Candidatus Colwellia aromaticivorans TaxID=2267621 RepID=UPI000DF2F745|nr:hypothetical protein [Candidatus Colwellia aromaticivorans]